MINEKEIESITLSACRKDFYQIWNELLESAKLLSERWDPTSTNEADPGIVILKELVAVADKLNYQIDKNILEAYLPSAAQEESVRKVCDMLGYTMKYFQSATTEVTISYTGTDELPPTGLIIPRFTNIKNTDDDINYFTTKTIVLDGNGALTTDAIEGTLQFCADDSDNIVTLSLLDDNNRYYLPETQIAENGFFITNISEGAESNDWEKVDNLNTQKVGKQCFKFGFDSIKKKPYIQFPDDISSIIKDGLVIRYTRTSGADGNVSARTLCKLEEPEIWSNEIYANFSTALVADNFIATNKSAAVNGRNKETINSAYNNYKKTIGTFDTLVTCRDYMNRIYQMTTDTADTTPLVSNIIVSDIRDDINKAINLCTFSDYGIAYVDKSLQADNKDKISHFDLVLYPFTTVKGINSIDEYKNSFKYSLDNIDLIKTNLETNKTISHNIVYPGTTSTDIVCIKNYLRLKANITTTTKVSVLEEADVLHNIYTSIYENFNARMVDFGEEIDSSLIIDAIKAADSRVKNVSLEAPVLVTTFCLADGSEEFTTESYNEIYNKLALRNVLAGRIPLFKYDTAFATSFQEKKYTNFSPRYTKTDTDYISRVATECSIADPGQNKVTLDANEVIQFRAPSYKTTTTYPAYVNYFLNLDRATEADKFISKNAEYKLKSGEWLAVNYTPSTTSEDGTTSTGDPVNKVYTAGDVIKPNFTIYDSTYWAQSHTPSKKSGYDDMPEPQKGIINAAKGMFACAANEQIEIREPVEIKLDKSGLAIYWERNDEDPTIKVGNPITFIFDDDTPGKTNGTWYTLKEGEYFYYTDSAKLDLAYYGTGTKIIKTNNVPALIKIKSNATQLAEDIANNGLLAAIPWVTFNGTSDAEGVTGKNLTLKEYQYINLTEGDILESVTFESPATWPINNTWKTITDATYTYSDSTTPAHLSAIVIPGTNWEARSILNLNASPTATQTIHKGTYTTDTVTLYKEDWATETESLLVALTPTAADGPLSFKTNYLCQTSSGNYDAHKYTYTEDGNVYDHVNDFAVEVFKLDTELDAAKLLNLGNYGDGNWTKVSFYSYEKPPTHTFNLHAEIPAGRKGIIMFYYIDDNAKVPTPAIDNLAYLTLNQDTTATLKICNSGNGTTGKFTSDWWTGYKLTDKYHLRAGLNIVEVSGSCTITVHPDAVYKGALVFGNLDLVHYQPAEGTTAEIKYIINPRIDYRGKEEGSTSTIGDDQIFKDIAAIDQDYNFYYNTVIDNSLAIKLNTAIEVTEATKADGTADLLSSPRIWYDYNNINNKFVVSEISADYLVKGITIDPSSKRR